MNCAWIQLENVWCTFERQTPVHALRGVWLTLGMGEFVAIAGPSGSGKSTLLYTIAGLRTPTSGTLTVMGEERPSPHTMSHLRASEIGFVFQAFHLDPHLSATENVARGARYSGRPERWRIENAKERLRQVGLSDRLGHRPRQLSGGEQQRVAVARALINGPALLLADEPTGNLDSTTGDEILRTLTSVHAGGTTVVLVTHSREAAAVANRVIHMKDGAIREPL